MQAVISDGVGCIILCDSEAAPPEKAARDGRLHDGLDSLAKAGSLFYIGNVDGFKDYSVEITLNGMAGLQNGDLYTQTGRTFLVNVPSGKLLLTNTE